MTACRKNAQAISERRRTRRLSPGVLFLCLVMSVGTFGVVSSAPTVSASVSPDCVPCPGSPGCYPHCQPPPCTPPVIVAQPAVQGGYRQAWVNWSITNGTYSGFDWGTSTSYGFPMPSPSGSSMNLNDLNSGTTYYYQVWAHNSCGSSFSSGSFATSAAPTTGFVGWVSQLVSDPHQLNQIGNTIVSGATVYVGANCGIGGNPFYIPAATTSGSGHYSFTFPISYSQQGGLFTWTLSSSGVCTYSIEWIGSYNTANSHYLLKANKNGFWNATQYVSSTLSGSNDYRQFGLLLEGQSISTPGISWSHTSDATCGTQIVTTISQTVYAYLAGSGYNDQQQWVSGAGANPVANGVSEVDFHYYTSGVINETFGEASVDGSWAVGPMFDPSQNAVKPSDPLPSPPPGQTYPIPGYPGYYVDTVGGNGGYLQFKNGGSFTQTQGLDISIGLGGGWNGVAVNAGGSASVDLSYGTTTGVSSSAEITCTLVDSQVSQGMNEQFYYEVDGSGSASQEAINMHVWFDDFCVPNNTTCD